MCWGWGSHRQELPALRRGRRGRGAWGGSCQSSYTCAWGRWDLWVPAGKDKKHHLHVSPPCAFVERPIRQADFAALGVFAGRWTQLRPAQWLLLLLPTLPEVGCGLSHLFMDLPGSRGWHTERVLQSCLSTQGTPSFGAGSSGWDHSLQNSSDNSLRVASCLKKWLKRKGFFLQKFCSPLKVSHYSACIREVKRSKTPASCWQHAHVYRHHHLNLSPSSTLQNYRLQQTLKGLG